MDIINETEVTEFILVGFVLPPQAKVVLFVILLSVYLVIITGNSLVIVVTLADSRLHSPMYFFLCNLSFLDVCCSAVVAPTLLTGLLVQRIIITLAQCRAQLYMAVALGEVECILLAVMAWDRYVAICRPLNYPQIMTDRVCVKLATFTWSSGFIFSLSTVAYPEVHFCGHNVIDHIICEPDVLSKIVCRMHPFQDYLNLLLSFYSFVTPSIFILFTYCRIIFTIMRMATAESRHRTFATCGSHLLVITLFYGTALMAYAKPKSAVSSEKNKFIILCMGLVPACNPLIYTLKNKEVRRAMKKLCTGDISIRRPTA